MFGTTVVEKESCYLRMQSRDSRHTYRRVVAGAVCSRSYTRSLLKASGTCIGGFVHLR